VTGCGACLGDLSCGNPRESGHFSLGETQTCVNHGMSARFFQGGDRGPFFLADMLFIDISGFFLLCNNLNM
jgi:hypothetical protein